MRSEGESENVDRPAYYIAPIPRKTGEVRWGLKALLAGFVIICTRFQIISPDIGSKARTGMYLQLHQLTRN